GRTVDDPAPLPAPAKARVPSVVIAAGVLGICLLLAAGVLALRGSFPWPTDQVVATTSPGAPSSEAPQAVAVTPAVTPRPVTVPSAPQPTAAKADAPLARPAAKPEVLTSAPNRSRVAPGKVLLFKECDVCPEMVAIPAGTNLLGSPDTEPGHGASEGPQRQIVIANAFAAGRSEVSFAEWLACVAEGGCNAYRPGDYDWGYGRRPVINVSWTDAHAYVAWLSRKTGATYRLLSEAEWEYAARGCVTVCASTPFWFGAEISNARANYDWRYSYDGSPKAMPPRKTVDVDASEPNPFGLLHVHGNVREWVEDCWNGSLAGLPADGSARMTGDCNSHVVRGGSWADEPKDLRSAARSWEVTAERRAQIGFRVARALAP
ncbi:MAG: SUMF1/EgtB/PvdO family nonheme iron enzyme, partial [Alphaproteobacteria bacterium]|nr:SUMF1/EgtB/PvdO family nonheme iron enzyme [Alphaproteobacteria bacterium]